MKLVVVFKRPVTGTWLEMVSPIGEAYPFTKCITAWMEEHLGSNWRFWGAYQKREFAA